MIDQVKVWYFGRYEPMLKLMLKIGRRLVFVRRYDMTEAEFKLLKHLKRLRETFEKGISVCKAEAIRWRNSQIRWTILRGSRTLRFKGLSGSVGIIGGIQPLFSTLFGIEN